MTYSAVLAACDKAQQWQWTLKNWMDLKNAGAKRPHPQAYCYSEL